MAIMDILYSNMDVVSEYQTVYLQFYTTSRDFTSLRPPVAYKPVQLSLGF